MKAEIKQELDRLAARSPGGVLEPSTVVKAAQNKHSPLHRCFTWDMKQSHKQHLLWEARQLISQYEVVYVAKNGGKPIMVRHFISLTTDRLGSGGYRTVADVMADPTLRKQALADALTELEIFRAKYYRLKALQPIFHAMALVNRRRNGKAVAKEARAEAR